MLGISCCLQSGSEAAVVDDDGEVGGEEFDRDGQQDDAEEFAQHEHHLVAQPALQFFEQADDDIVDDDVEQQAQHDVDRGVFGAEGDEGRDGTRAGDEREGDGHDAGACPDAFVLDEFAPHDHFQRQQEEHEGTRHGEGGDVDAEQVEQRLAHEEEDQEEQQRHRGGLEGVDVLALVLHADEDGDGARDVDDSEHHDEHADYLYEADLLDDV